MASDHIDRAGHSGDHGHKGTARRGAERYYAKRAVGASPVRHDGSLYRPDVDEVAYEAEVWAARRYGAGIPVPVMRDEDGWPVSSDGGFDFRLPDGRTVDVKHLGLLPDGSPRMTGRLICRSTMKNYPDILLSVRGLPGSFEVAGWITRERFLAEREQVDLGFGPCWALPLARLTPPKE
jgi:hypothetical protein